MTFTLPEYIEPDFSAGPLASARDAVTAPAPDNGVAPDNFHATTIYPEYFRINGQWVLATQSRMDCVAVVRGGGLDVVEFRNLKKGDAVVLGRTEDGGQGIYVHAAGFAGEQALREAFVFRTGRTRETSYSRDYDTLYDVLRYEKDNGYTVWVLGPAVSFDSDSRGAMVALIEAGYVDAVLAGNALATHDVEGAVFKTALGQDIYTQVSSPGGHYHHLDVLNRVRGAGGLEAYLNSGAVDSGIMRACMRAGVPVVLAGSIRDDGPMPEVIGNVYAAQDAMRAHARRATTMISLATQLHAIATGNMTPAYQVVNGRVRPVFIYTVDISEFAVNKLRDRGSLEVTSIVTNVQDFLVNIKRNLIGA
jgi:lysine-ketoglutarate reductase/saccharopine dehydrogenase-like protein (TIGR00300 family)